MTATVFLTGLFGVFFGMAFLYLSIKATGAAATALAVKQTTRQTAKKEG